MYFKMINPNTKRAENLRWIYYRNDGSSLYDAYKTVSYAKARAFEDWKRYVYYNNKSDLHICSHNCMKFTLGFEDDFCYYVITADNNYCIPKSYEIYKDIQNNGWSVIGVK